MSFSETKTLRRRINNRTIVCACVVLFCHMSLLLFLVCIYLNIKRPQSYGTKHQFMELPVLFRQLFWILFQLSCDLFCLLHLFTWGVQLYIFGLGWHFGFVSVFFRVSPNIKWMQFLETTTTNTLLIHEEVNFQSDNIGRIFQVNYSPTHLWPFLMNSVIQLSPAYIRVNDIVKQNIIQAR